MPSSDEDLTFYVSFDQLTALDKRIDDERANSSLHKIERRADGTRECRIEFTTTRGQRLSGRALVCRCFAGRRLSVTVRVQKVRDDEPPPLRWPDRAVKLVRANLKSDGWPGLSADSGSPNRQKTRRTVGVFHECRANAEQKGDHPVPRGLVVVSGRTGSSKSSIARELAWSYLRILFDRAQRGQRPGVRERPPHVVTFEDPVEHWFADTAEVARAAGFDYTPRQIGTDAACLADALRDALRQTPTIVYVGESRDESDWRDLLAFAGTGHLALTTTHAGSLIETMGHILRAAKANTPAARSEVARRIHLLTHIRVDDVTQERVPTLWLNTRRSVNAMTAEGLGSMLPHMSGVQGTSQSSFGRAHFVRELRHLKNDKALLRRAMAWDLAGE